MNVKGLWDVQGPQCEMMGQDIPSGPLGTYRQVGSQHSSPGTPIPMAPRLLLWHTVTLFLPGGPAQEPPYFPKTSHEPSLPQPTCSLSLPRKAILLVHPGT